MYWIVKSINRAEHTVEVSKFNKNLSQVKVPVMFPLPGKGSELLIDEDTRTVTCIVTLSSLRAQDSDPEQDVVLDDGDVGYSLSGLGFMAIRKGLRAVLGAGSTGIFIDGKLKEMAFYTNRFLVAGNGFSCDLAAPDSPTGMPELHLNMGSIFSLTIKPSNKEFSMDLFGIAVITVNSDKFTVKSINPYNGTSRFIVNETYKADSVFDTPSDVIKQFSAIYQLVLKLNTVNVLGKEATASFASLALKASAGATISAASLLLKGKNDLNLEGSNIVATVGDGAKPGSFHINNGTASHFRMGSKGIGMYGSQYIKLNGDNDNLVSYNEFKKFAEEVAKALEAIVTYGANPYGLPSVMANVTAPYGKIKAMLISDIIKNKGVKVGYIVGNPKGSE